MTNTETWDEYRKLIPKGYEPEKLSTAGGMRDKIIIDSVYLTKSVVGKMKKSMPPHVEADDLESLAKIGLLKAVTRYDHTMGVPWEAFARQCMGSAIMDGIRDADWAPRSLRKKQRDIKVVEDNALRDSGKVPTHDEIADTLGITAEEVATTKYKSSIASHTYLEANTEAQNKVTATVAEEDENELVFVMRQTLASALKQLPTLHAVIVALHYYQELKLAPIAKLLRMSEVRVGAVHREAVLFLWEKLSEALENV